MNVPQRRSSGLLWLWLTPIAVVTVAAFFFWRGSRGSPSMETADGFNLRESPQVEQYVPPPAPYETRFERESKERSQALMEGPGLAGFVPEGDRAFAREVQASARVSEETRKREREFIRKWDPVILEHEKNFISIGRKYHKQYPIVRQVDREFAQIPGWMALKRRYYKDRDPFSWARDAFSLPGVKGKVLGLAGNREVLKVSILVAAENMKKPPPKALQEEAARFVASDKKTGELVTEVAGKVLPNLGPVIATQIPPGVDLGPVAGLASQLGNVVPGVAVPPGLFDRKGRPASRNSRSVRR